MLTLQPWSCRTLRALATTSVVLTMACSHQPRPQQPAAPPTGTPPPASASQVAPPATAASTPARPPKAAPAPIPLPQPPDGKWLVDLQGREYFVDKVEKKEGFYVWLNPEKTIVQVRYGAIYEVVGEDATDFQVKIYKPVDVERPGPAPVTPDQLEAVAASYRNDTKSADRLEFEPFSTGLPASGQWRNGFAIADMNGDGHPDIVTGPERKGRRAPNIFLGDGKGNWRLWSEAEFPNLAYDYGNVAIADFNRDGRLDLALAIHLHGFIVLVADGPHSFKEWGRGLDFVASSQDRLTQGGFSSRALAVADMNGDGRPDLVALGEGPTLAMTAKPGEVKPAALSGGYGMFVYFNQGDGTWVRQDEEDPQHVKLHGEKVVVADFTGDGHPDVVLGSNVMGVNSILRIGAPGGKWTSAKLEGLRPGLVGGVTVADFDRDGRLDLAIGYLSSELGVWRTGVDLFLGRPDGTWLRRPVAFEEGRAWLTALTSGDLDGDGKLDLAALTGDGKIWLLLGNGDGSFVRQQAPDVKGLQGCWGYDVAIADLDGKPGQELVAEFAGEPSALFAPDQCVTEGAIVAWKPRRHQ